MSLVLIAVYDPSPPLHDVFLAPSTLASQLGHRTQKVLHRPVLVVSGRVLAGRVRLRTSVRIAVRVLYQGCPLLPLPG